MGTVSDACGRRKRGYAAAPDASTLCTVPRDLHHGQASRCGLHATPWWQAPVCVAPLLSPPAELRAVSKALLHPATNAAGWRQCRGQTGFSQLNNPQHNPQRRAFSLNPCTSQGQRSSRDVCTPECSCMFRFRTSLAQSSCLDRMLHHSSNACKASLICSPYGYLPPCCNWKS